MERFHAVTSIYENLPEQKKAGLLKKEDYFGTPTCPPFYWVSTRFHISNRPLPFHLHLHEISKFLDPET